LEGIYSFLTALRESPVDLKFLKLQPAPAEGTSVAKTSIVRQFKGKGKFTGITPANRGLSEGMSPFRVLKPNVLLIAPSSRCTREGITFEEYWK
jgi:hypothetical protein